MFTQHASSGLCYRMPDILCWRQLCTCTQCRAGCIQDRQQQLCGLHGAHPCMAQPARKVLDARGGCMPDAW